jgi:hypothetical protein
MQTLSPYWDLQQSSARPSSTILMRKHSLPITSFFPLLRHQHFIAAAIVFTAFLSEFLVIALSGLPYRPGQLPNELFFCGVASIFILATMIFVLVVVNIWRTSLPSIPRKPNNIASVMMHVSESRMCDDFEGTQGLTTRERDERVRRLGKRYFYGVEGDGIGRKLVIDEIQGKEKVSKYDM